MKDTIILLSLGFLIGNSLINTTRTTRIENKLDRPLETAISISDPNLALLIAEKDATILSYRDKIKVLEKRYYKLAEDFQESVK